MGSYGRILRTPHLAPLFAATLLARLPIGINALAAVLFLREETGSFGVAGAVAGALALGAGMGAPVGARLIDRFGRGVLFGLALAHAAGLGALVALGFAGAHAVPLVAAALVAGLAMPPTSSVMRSMYPRLFDDEQLLRGAYALDATTTETLFVIGPLLTAAAVALVNPAAALGLSAAAVVTGVSWFLVALPPGERDRTMRAADGERDWLGALRSPGIRTLVLSMVPVGFALGSLEIAVPAFADEHGRPELAGVLLALWSIASAAGALVYGARSRSSLAGAHVGLAMLLPLSIAPLLLAGPPLVMAALLIPGGVFIAPLIASRNELAGVVAPPGAATEAFTWPLTALVCGVSLGAGVAGSLVDASGWRAPVVAAIAASAVGAIVAATRRSTLEPGREAAPQHEQQPRAPSDPHVHAARSAAGDG